MNRRSFLTCATALAAVIPATTAAHVASAEVAPAGLRLTSKDPPEPGFKHVRGVRVFCDGVEVKHCVRVDTSKGVAWAVDTNDRDYLQVYGQLREVEYHGHISLEMQR